MFIYINENFNKVKIGISVLICLPLSANCREKTRENFQADINFPNLIDDIKVFGNRIRRIIYVGYYSTWL